MVFNKIQTTLDESSFGWTDIITDQIIGPSQRIYIWGLPSTKKLKTNDDVKKVGLISKHRQ